MERFSPERPATRQSDSLAHVFVFPELFAAQTLLLLDREAHMALLLSLEEGGQTLSLRSFPLTPSSARVFLALLQAYPRHCSHRALFAALYPLPPGENENERVWEKALALQPIRRALKTLLPMLRAFGLQVVALRGRGYVLASLPPTTAPAVSNSSSAEGPSHKQGSALPRSHERSGASSEAEQETTSSGTVRNETREGELPHRSRVSVQEQKARENATMITRTTKVSETNFTAWPLFSRYKILEEESEQ